MYSLEHSLVRFAWFFILIASTCVATGRPPDGTIDSTFGSGGRVITSFGPGYDSGYGVAVQADGKIVVTGESQVGATDSNYDVALVRYSADGSLDNSFGSSGMVTTAISSDWDLSGSVALQSDGKIVVAGQTLNGPNFDFVTVRYNTDGNLDNGFGTGGIVKTPVGPSLDAEWFCALQPDEKILVVGPVHNGSDYDFGIVRHNPDGSLDNTFGSGGKVITSVNSGNDFSWSCAVQSDGKIVVAGRSLGASSDDFALVRYLTNGSLDASFGTSGKVTTPVGPGSDRGRFVAIQADDKIVLGGTSTIGSTDDFALVRYNSDGSVDNSFGNNGIVTTAVGTGEDILWAVAIQHDGKILAAGYGISAVSGYDFAVVRYNQDGSLDSSFGNNGIGLTPVGTSSDFGIGLALQPDEKIVLAGASVTAAGYDFSIVRYNNSPPTSISPPAQVTQEFTLFDSYPNPFNSTTRIRFRIPGSEFVSLMVYDLLGHNVAELVNENLGPGNHERTFEAKGLASGIYLYRLQAGPFHRTKKLVLIK